MSIFRTKDVELMIKESKRHGLIKSLGAFDITLIGIGVIIGTGIFVLTGVAAAQYAGPALMLSFVLAGLTVAFVSLAFSELAAMIPVAGSAYTYTYTALGEALAFWVGWGLVLEYTVGASAVAGGWSAYFTGILASGGIHLPEALTKVPSDGGIVNLPAVLISLFLMLILVRGTRESVNLNKILVFIKLGAIFIFLFLAGPQVNPANWDPFLPFGWQGVATGAAVIFFAYLGIDSIATSAEEAKNPGHDMPIGILASLSICTVLYITVTAVMTGTTPYPQLDTAEPVTYVLRNLGYNLGSALVGTGAIAGLTTVLVVMMYAQTRSFFAMSRDGLIPRSLCRLHPKFGSPYIVTFIVGIAVALLSGFTPIHLVAEMCSIGTLFAFFMSIIGVMRLRKTKPHWERPFKCPALFIIGPLALIFCAFVMGNLPAHTWRNFLIWMTVGVIVYFAYGRTHSVLAKTEEFDKNLT
ncbi:amino acid permease [Desulfotomaculum defluvii]